MVVGDSHILGITSHINDLKWENAHIRLSRLIFGIFTCLALVLQHTWRQQGEREVRFDKTSLIPWQLFQRLVTGTGYVLYELYCILIVFIFS